MRTAAARAGLLLAVLLPACATIDRHPANGADSLAWLAGHWVMATPGGRVEELWLPPDGGTLYGVGRTISGGQTQFFEFLAIEPREGATGATLAFVARPRGKEPTEFLRVENRPGRVVFANPEHDFPKRILYERRGDTLHARVDDGTDEGTGEDFDYALVE